ncbi:MAG TPA: hypothetical protein PKK12_07400 [Candidatus Aminicenantes bacterium]|mgnify:CR=1 FL=1|nr:hypothetical protein [Candidatus Aminicenantes bacterium]
MNHQEANDNSQQANAEAIRQPWITPTFERIELKEAMSGSGAYAIDGFTYQS